MICFLHAADLHLDSPFRALPPELAQQRRTELRQLPMTLAQLANEHRCALVLLAGDLFDTVGGYPETVDALIRAARATRAHIFIAPGNHDFYAPGSPYASADFPENVHIFRTPQPEAVVLPELGCTIYGAAFPAERAPALLEGFRVQDPGTQNLMVLHGDALNAGSPYNPVSEVQIAASGLDYLALGHIHARTELRHAGGTAYAWPGCPMGRGFDETGEKGVYLGTLDSGETQLQFLPIPGRRYEVLSVPAGDDPLSAILAALPEDTTRDSYRILLTGEADAPNLRALEQALHERFYALSLRDETHPRAALWAGVGENTLRGLFLARLKVQWDAAGEEDRRRIELAARYGLAALDGREVPQP